MRNITNNDFKNPEKPKFKYLGFKYSGAKLFNMLLLQMRETKDPNAFKTMSKDWRWKNIPSYYVRTEVRGDFNIHGTKYF